MSHRALATALVLATVAGLLWRHELFTVQAPGDTPRPLAALPPASRPTAAFNCVLPAVPIGMRPMRAGDGPLLVHYWAPWQQGAYTQAAALDSLRRTPGLEAVRIEVVCFDPFPSVARYVARRRLALPVLLDTRGLLRAQLPCPSIPYTYVLDAAGRIAVHQPGRVDWLAPVTRTTLERIAHERVAPQRSLAVPA